MKKSYMQEDEKEVLCAVYEEGVLERFYRFPKDVYSGSIVVGKVKFVRKEVGIFVDIGLERDGILGFRPGLKSGDTVLVRIETEPQEGRGCSLTERINIVGKYAILLDREEYKFSSEISQEKKNRLFTLPRLEGVGFIFRSLAQEGTLEEIGRETSLLYEKYKSLLTAAKTVVKPTFLYREDPVTLARNTAHETVDFFDRTVRKDVAELSERKVVREGVELVFDQTEAMTVVDVNFHSSREQGKYAVFAADAIAVKEFARQVRLRNIGGLILLDYISLVQKEERDRLYDLLKEELNKDFVRCETDHSERMGLFIVSRPRRYGATR